MKGPGFRLDYDVRRVWRCPECGGERRALGDLVALRCGCRPDGVWMTLTAEPVRHPKRCRSPKPPTATVTPIEAMPVVSEQLPSNASPRGTPTPVVEQPRSSI